MNGKQYAVIVDPTSSGGLFPAELKKHNIESIAVHSQPLPDIPLAKSYFRKDFCEEFTLDEDYDSLAGHLSEFNPVGVFAGNEPGVPLADRLTHHFDFPGNDISLTTARTNKYEMQETIRRSGLRAIEQTKSDNLDSILQWLSEGDRLPVFVKPLSSGGTDGVRLCDTVEKVKSCFSAILASNNMFGFPNKEVLVQQYIHGTEYVVDSTSCDGVHFALEIGKYRKFIGEGGSPVYREMRVLDPDRKVHAELLEYNEKVLDALGIRYGSSHSEIMLTDDGPVLIETGARLCGVYMPRCIKECARFSQLELTVESALFPKVFFEKLKQGQKFEKHATMFCLCSGKSGVVRSFPGRKAIEGLSSFVSGMWRAAEGNYQGATIDLLTCPGFVFLANKEKSGLEADIAFIESLEKEERLLEFS